MLFSFVQFNFVGKLLGPKGNTFKRLQASTGTKMSILGKGSMREKEKVSYKSLSMFFQTLNKLVMMFKKYESLDVQ